MTSDSEQIRAEEIIPQKWERCTANLLVNSGFGLATGIVASVVLFRRRFWPIPLSVGFAAGKDTQ
jgi:inner membrane organizing system protein 1